MSCKIGIIGGAGPLASSLAYQFLVEKFYEEKKSFSEIHLINYPFTKGLSLFESEENQNKLVNQLQHCFDLFKKNGIKFVQLVCNTLHELLPFVKTYHIEVVSLPKSVQESVAKEKLEKVLVLATPTTVNRKLYSFPNAVFLNVDEQKMLDKVIHQILLGTVSKKEQDLLKKLILRVFRNNTLSGVVLGCTDLSVLNHRYPLVIDGIKFFDSVLIGVQSLYNTLVKRGAL